MKIYVLRHFEDTDICDLYKDVKDAAENIIEYMNDMMDYRYTTEDIIETVKEREKDGRIYLWMDDDEKCGLYITVSYL